MSTRDRTRIGARTGRRRQLVEAALGLVQHAGLSALDAAAVAEAAGVSKALVFYYFPSHVELQAAVVQGVADDLVEQLRIPADDALTPRDQIANGLRKVFATIEQDPAIFTALARGAGGHPRLFDVYDDTRNRIVEGMSEDLGILDPPLWAQLAIRGWVAMVEDVVLHWIVNDRAVERDRLIDYLAELCVHALRRAEILGAPLNPATPGVTPPPAADPS
jgi:AcrR family transcriptional regulator